ncbi:DUF7701 domain-containing protein [Actinomadura bangladeshensis]|uniref:DUF7701 domain-containing protein n=1 Tax=Actinomadura bangladeshensis TaxID=453573 RepID=A0A4R4P8K6_9ACTN|nr:hypothetical protein [Actinomadura bangladeshensis]TDC17250.1 hypothetical protein E1284_09870 [Actinomadura bangladeshensis]
MSYIDDIADLVRGCLPSEALPPEDAAALFLIYALLVRAKGQATTAEDVHDAWSAWMATVNPEHDALLPFDELSVEARAQDAAYVRAIHDAALRLEKRGHL